MSSKSVNGSSSFVYQKEMKNVNHNFPEPKVTSSNVLFCPTHSVKNKDIQFIMTEKTEKQQILIFEKLEPENVSHFSW